MGLFSFLFRPNTPVKRTSSVLSCPYSSPYVILDVETTGLNPSSDKIIQLSAIKYDIHGSPIDLIDTYINPQCTIPSAASRINGITDKMVASAPTITDVRAKFLSFVEESLVVGYNVDFDLRFLNQAFSGDFNARQYVDVLAITRQLLSMPNYKLETVSSALGFCPDDSFHNALTDCEAVAHILRSLDTILTEHVREFQGVPSRRHNYTNPKNKFSPKSIISNISCVDQSHPFFGKNIVFTGTLNIMRHEAAQMAADKGAIIRGSVSKRTDYLVVGAQDLALVGDDGMSSKEEKAVALNASGEAHIHIIRESEFLHLLGKSEEGN